MNEIFRIKLKDEDRSPFAPLYIAGKKRTATATGVRFINDHRVVIANLVAARLYLFDIDIKSKKHTLLDDIDCLLDSSLNFPDLIDFDGKDRIVCSYFMPGAQAIFRLSDHKLTQINEIDKLVEYKQFCHGVRFHPIDKDVIVTTGNKTGIVNFVHIEKREIVRQISYISDFIPKDMCFVTPNKLLVIYTTSKIGRENVKQLNVVAHVVLFELHEDHEDVLNVYEQPDCHIDSMCIFEDLIFFQDQNTDSITVLKLKNDQLTFVGKSHGFDFPHGLDARKIDQKIVLAVTNYGDNTVRFLNVEYQKQEM
ncbi:MAG TPA: hypothetical protein PKC30_08390 [Saprospiraceae bacterium]|nr:hypothetical protein [Saprospiraceae bacterium]